MIKQPKPKPKPIDRIEVQQTPDGVVIRHEDGRTHIEPLRSLKQWAIGKFRKAFPYV